MKRILFCLLAIIAVYSCNNTESKNDDSQDMYVYICTGGYATKYHAYPNCKGLRNCGGTIKAISIEDAEKMGRTPCQICN